MLIDILIFIIVKLFQTIFILFPEVSLADMPLIGSFLYDFLVLAVRMWNSFMITLPYAKIAWDAFVFVLLPFELAMIVLQFFLGSRSPVKNSD